MKCYVKVLGYTLYNQFIRLILTDTEAKLSVESLDSGESKTYRLECESCSWLFGSDRKLSDLRLRMPKQNEEPEGSFLAGLTVETLDKFITMIQKYNSVIYYMRELCVLDRETKDCIPDHIRKLWSSNLTSRQEELFSEMTAYVDRLIEDETNKEAAETRCALDMQIYEKEQSIANLKKTLP